MFGKDKAIGLVVATMFASGVAQAADQRFKTQVDAEQTRADIVERAASGSPETVRSGSSLWGNHSPLTSTIAQTAIGVINEGASAALDQLKTTQEELAQTQAALQSTQAALQIAQSDLSTTKSNLDSVKQEYDKFQDSVVAELEDIRSNLGSGGGSATSYKTFTLTHYQQERHCPYDCMYFYQSYILKLNCKESYDGSDKISGVNAGWTETPHPDNYYENTTYWNNNAVGTLATKQQARSILSQRCSSA